MANLTDRQLSDLLYRDNLVLKHSAAQTVWQAVQTLSDNTAAEKPSTSDSAGGKNPDAVLVDAILEFLIEASQSITVFLSVLRQQNQTAVTGDSETGDLL